MLTFINVLGFDLTELVRGNKTRNKMSVTCGQEQCTITFCSVNQGNNALVETTGDGMMSLEHIPILDRSDLHIARRVNNQCKPHISGKILYIIHKPALLTTLCFRGVRENNQVFAHGCRQDC